jgi:hypothetical protein
MLLLSQQLGLAHAATHLSSDIASSASHDKKLPDEMHCAQCLAFASIGSALTGPSFSWHCDTIVFRIAVAAKVDNIFPCTVRAFDSRAPPSIS